MKRFIDISFSSIGIILLSPIFLFTIFFVFIDDLKSPFYTPLRMGKDLKPFRMIKFRSMSAGADKTGVSSTSSNDSRITSVGKIIRKFKIDELSQLFNVFIGNMSIVGPRPQIIDHVLNKYSDEEKKLLTVRPGITDFSSIVFSDEGEILKFSKDPDTDYNLLIRPWKSRLGLLYIKTRTNKIDLFLILLTIIAIFSKKKALYFLNKLLKKINAPENLVSVSKRENRLKPSTPPGVDNLK